MQLLPQSPDGQFQFFRVRVSDILQRNGIMGFIIGGDIREYEISLVDELRINSFRIDPILPIGLHLQILMRKQINKQLIAIPHKIIRQTLHQHLHKLIILLAITSFISYLLNILWLIVTLPSITRVLVLKFEM